ncbi:MAG: phosphoribosylformylglycinamidine synthase subunit PurL, partial [Trueperaceae bacterium]
GLTGPEYDRLVAGMGPHPLPLEAAMAGALWSEHCGYKNSKPLLRRLPTEGPRVLQGPGENAGVVDLGDGWALAFKMESHNHPSAVEPYQGAATGVGGILRDIFAMGARPVALLDSLRFGPLDHPRTRHLLNGVVEGISSYGNAVGVPTVGGDLAFHDDYLENPLVNVMALGVMRTEALQSGTVGEPGNKLLYVGSRTGRDGLGGAVFASADLHGASSDDRPAVQVGDPFLEKLLLEATLAVIEAAVVVGVQDMGAAGLTSSVAEMAHRAGRGVDLHVDRVPRREKGMTPLETMLSESQERMVLTIAPDQEEAVLRVLKRFELDAAWIGEVQDHERFRVLEHGRVVADLPVTLVNEPPTYEREHHEDPTITAARAQVPDPPQPDDLGEALARLIAAPGLASTRTIWSQYDHQVRTDTVVPPGAADAAVLRIKGARQGIAATVDANPRQVLADPYRGAVLAVAEAYRNLSAVGADPLGVSDNLNFGNPERPHVYHQMVRAVDGLRDACLALGTPVTGGNVSLYNQWRDGETERAIPPSPTVGMVGVLPDVTRYATTGLKRAGDRVWLVGTGSDELGASAYLAHLHGQAIGAPPACDLAREAAVGSVVRSLIQDGRIDTAHDVGEGGLALALAEMTFAEGIGLAVDLTAAGPAGTRPDALAFGEAPGRIVIAAPIERAGEIEARLHDAGVPWSVLGRSGGGDLVLRGKRHTARRSVADLRTVHEATLQEAMA